MTAESVFSHHPVFRHFRPWSGVVPPGRSINFLGVITRDAFTEGMTGGVSTESRNVETGYPPVDEEYLEWVDVLEAVLSTEGVFTMIELGAGYGRWLMNGAAAARIRNVPFRLVGVEAEPTHFRWMEQHFADNGVPRESLTLIEAAVAAEDGWVRFYVGDPSGWYGQAIDPNQPLPSKPPNLRSRMRRALEHRPDDRAIVEVPSVSLASVLGDVDRVDLIDLDVQGVEAEVLEPAADALATKVKRLHIGTHSTDNEQRLRTLFQGLGWEKLNDYPAFSEADTPWGRISFQDGVQTWLNPRL